MKNLLLKNVPNIVWRPKNKPRKRISMEREPSKPGPFRATSRPWLLFLLLIPLYLLLQAIATDRGGSVPQFYVIEDTMEDTRIIEAGKDTGKMMGKYKFAVPKIKEKSTQKTVKLKIDPVTTTEKGKEMRKATIAGPSPKPPCPTKQSSYGKYNLTIANITMELLSRGLNPILSLVKDGWYKPEECSARHKVAILVPYRDREMNLAIFLYNIHPFLIKQKIEYRIFVVEQYGDDIFNKGRLFNAGFKEMQKYGKFSCIVLHDVDLLPAHERILYGCPVYPRHMCSTVLEKKSDPNYRTIFGGVVAMTCEHYQKANGFSNLYWGWGGEDNDMFWRIRAARLPVVRYDKRIAEYVSLPHPRRPLNPYRYMLISTASERYQDEGLSTVEYRLISQKNYPLYTHMLIDINPYGENVTSLMLYYADKQFYGSKARKKDRRRMEKARVGTRIV